MGLSSYLRSLKGMRRSQRVSGNIQIEVFSEGGSSQQAHTHNASESGVLFAHERPIAINAMVNLQFHLGPSETEPLTRSGVSAVVVRCQEGSGGGNYLIGARYVDVDHSTADRVRYMINVLAGRGVQALPVDFGSA